MIEILWEQLINFSIRVMNLNKSPIFNLAGSKELGTIDNTDTQPMDVMTLPTPSPPQTRAESFHDAECKRKQFQGMPPPSVKRLRSKTSVVDTTPTPTAVPAVPEPAFPPVSHTGTSDAQPPSEPPSAEVDDGRNWKVLHGDIFLFHVILNPQSSFQC